MLGKRHFEEGWSLMAPRKEKDMEEYKGYFIEEMYEMISVQYCGDDVVFRSVDEAKQFIDEVSEED